MGWCSANKICCLQVGENLTFLRRGDLSVHVVAYCGRSPYCVLLQLLELQRAACVPAKLTNIKRPPRILPVGRCQDIWDGS